MPKPLRYLLVIAIMAALVPPAVIARARAVNSKVPRIHYVLDMDNQLKFRAQHGNDLFADGRAMRPPVEGTVARGELRADSLFEKGFTVAADGTPTWATAYPDGVTLDRSLLERGRTRYNIFCQPCHGLAGYGDGMVNMRAMELLNTPARANGTAWVPAKSLHEEAIRDQPIGQVFNSITNGVRTMAGYGAQIPTADRWAIVAYVKALQRSQNVAQNEIPDAEFSRMLIVDFPGPLEAEADDADSDS